MTKPIAMITGATSGIGKACAELLAPSYQLIICGRRQERLDQLALALKEHTTTLSLCFDVREREAIDRLIKELPVAWQPIDVLINNAGNAHGMASIESGSVEDWDAMIDINVKGLLYVTKAVLPSMISRKKGHIVNVGSIAGIEVYPKGNVYNASKFGVDAITKGMRLDLYDKGIKVSEVKPGLVETEFSEVRFKGDKERAKQVYQGFDPLQARDIAETIAFILSRPKHVTIGDVLILPASQASATLVHKKS